jgi:hypothetical protein
VAGDALSTSSRHRKFDGGVDRSETKGTGQTLVVASHNHAETAKEKRMERISIRNLSFVEGDVGVVERRKVGWKREINKLGWVEVR